jgi:hypothetical protein
MIIFGQDVNETEPLYTVVEIENWYIHYGKQNGSSSKNFKKGQPYQKKKKMGALHKLQHYPQ